MLALRTPQGPRPIATIVCDLDRTLTDARLRVVPTALAALNRARALGVRTILATGRSLQELKRRTHLLAGFDALILEGGGLSGTPGHLRPTKDPADRIDRLAAWLHGRNIPLRRGRTAVSVPVRYRKRLESYPNLRAFAIHRNQDRLDVTLHGVNKGSALRRLLRTYLQGKRGLVLCFGDAPNDAELLRAADYGVAVANASPTLKRLADETTHLPGGRGVADFLRKRLSPS